MSATTPIHSIDPDDPDPSVIAEAARVLRHGGLVACATETVYGLGADATNPDAVARIFAAKGRPPTNPLIVHADSVAMARTCVRNWPAAAQTLAEHFWPGPLTLVLPRSAIIPDAVTSGLDTVGVRIPSHRVTQALIGALGRPVAAPSANRSTGVSPTLARHVAKDLSGKIDLILDSGPTTIGLESTVLDLTSQPPCMLRPGAITAEQIALVLGDLGIPPAGQAEDPTEPSLSPGRLQVHYAPRNRAILVEPSQLPAISWPDRSALLVFGPHDLAPVPPNVLRYDCPTSSEAAVALYTLLHACEDEDLDLIVIVPPPDLPDWCAIRDRLTRATRSRPPDSSG